jgi:hypothetical protein
MNRVTAPKPCVYCQINQATTRDHVVPRNLFLSPLPLNMVTVPACQSCNFEKSKNDDYLRDMLIVDIHCSEHSVAKALIAGKMKRAMQKNRSTIARTIVKQGRLAPMYTPSGIYLGDFPSFSLDGERINETFKTIARGLYYKLRNQRFPDGYSFEVLRIDPWYAQHLFDSMKAKGANGPYALGQVFACLFMCAAEDPGITWWLMQFYGGMVITVATEPTAFSNVILLPNGCGKAQE